jgi:DNA-binding NtrC family response regulator
MAASHGILGRSQPLRELRRQAARLSPYGDIPVLITGERGTGKERVARFIHHNGPRSGGPFIPVDCASIPESLLESELFGSEKGSYTGSEELRLGYFERAAGGVLFLDEIGNMPVGVQVKLLRVLQEGSFRRIGVTAAEVSIDFQVIAATNVDPETLVAQGKIREDFYDRIAAFLIRTPPLRECQKDIPELANHFIRQMGLEGRKLFTNNALQALTDAPWPGNVRQLQRTVQEAVVRSEDSAVLDVQHLPDRLTSSGSSTGDTGALPELPAGLTAAQKRIVHELMVCLETKEEVVQYKGKYWKAEFMRILYPDCKAQNAKGFSDLIRRLTKGPWGLEGWEQVPEIREYLEQLKS